MSYIRDATQDKKIFGILLADIVRPPRSRRIPDRGNDNDDDDPPPVGAISRRHPPSLSGGAAERPPLSLELECAA